MSKDETYNGYPNRETWAVALHINNDQGWQEIVHEALRSECTSRASFQSRTPAEQNRLAGDIIRENVENYMDTLLDMDVPGVPQRSGRPRQPLAGGLDGPRLALPERRGRAGRMTRPYEGRHAARPAWVHDRRAVRVRVTERVQNVYQGRHRA